INSYTITWENYDGTVLETDSVAYGSTPTYDGATPSRDDSAQYKYTFSGWSPSVVSVTSDATYIAQFSNAVYTITWENYDGTVLEVDNDVAYGSTPNYDGATPTREEDEVSPYLFSGWSPSVTFVNGDQTYTAQYVNGFLEFLLNEDNNSYSVTCQTNGNPISIEIPSTYLGKPVTSIGNYAFEGCHFLTSIVIPDSVTSIGNYAFEGCHFLTSIVIPNSVTSIGDGAFYNCTSLTSIVIPNSVTSIGGNAFSGCSSLTSIVIPDSVTSIGYQAFCYCSSLTSIVIPDSVTSIGEWAFWGCTSLTSIVIPDSVTSIGEWAFWGCTSLTIYAEARSKPSGWSSRWNYSNCPVVWGYVG
ncbi:MAG: leucine-rich repeat domain-containing protein, partial [Dehalococcoidales bacterium]